MRAPAEDLDVGHGGGGGALLLLLPAPPRTATGCPTGIHPPPARGRGTVSASHADAHLLRHLTPSRQPRGPFIDSPPPRARLGALPIGSLAARGGATPAPAMGRTGGGRGSEASPLPRPLPQQRPLPGGKEWRARGFSLAPPGGGAQGRERPAIGCRGSVVP